MREKKKKKKGKVYFNQHICSTYTNTTTPEHEYRETTYIEYSSFFYTKLFQIKYYYELVIRY